MGVLRIAVLSAAVAWSAISAAETPAAVSRFASVRHETVHVRAGPGQDYPIRWTFKRQHLPVQVLRDYENWRYIRDPFGEEGWVHANGLARRRTVVVTGSLRLLRAEPAEAAAALARVEPGVIGRLEKCDGGWCRIALAPMSGWIRQQEIWGVQPGERVD